MASRNAPAEANALAPASLTDDQITAILRQSGMIEAPTDNTDYNRVQVQQNIFTLGDDMYVSNPKTGEPALRVRILDAPVEFQAAWLTEPIANAIGRPNAANSFCKSYFNEPNQARKYAEDGTACGSCPIGPFVPKNELPEAAQGQKCKWKADVYFQVVDPDGTISDDTVWTMTLSTTDVIDFKGTAKQPEKGSVSDLTFMQRLARLGAEQNPDAPQVGALNALTSLKTGGVVADLYAKPAQNETGSIRWWVKVFDPVALIEVDQTPALTEGNGADIDPDDVPF